MPVTMICPNLKCGRTVIAPDKARGKVVRCSHCEQLFMVPTVEPKAAATTQSDGGAKKAASAPAKK